MNRAVLLGLGALLCAVAWLWWSDPSRRVLAKIEARYQAPELAPRPAAEAVSSDLGRVPQPLDRSELERLESFPIPEGEVISTVQGTITGGSEVFPGGDRSGVQVYCWPGWSAQQPQSLASLDDAPGIQVTTTDAAGNFSFELFVDDAHWLFAVANGMCSNPKGMRIGTKPGIEVSMQMRRLHGLRHRVVIDGQPKNEINFGTSLNRSLVEDAQSERVNGRYFPRAFFATTLHGHAESHNPTHGETFVWLAPQIPAPAALRYRASLPGCHPLDQTVALEPVSRTRPLKEVELLVHPQAELGEILLEFQGVPEIAQVPFCRSLMLPFGSLAGRIYVTTTFEGFHQFPLRLHHVPVGEYRLTPEDHPQARVDLGVPESVEVKAGKTTRVTLDFSQLEFLVFERDANLADWRYLTPPRVRIGGRGEASVSDWKVPRQMMILKPLGPNEEMVITGSVFRDGPHGPRKEGRVTVYTAGIDDD